MKRNLGLEIQAVLAEQPGLKSRMDAARNQYQLQGNFVVKKWYNTTYIHDEFAIRIDIPPDFPKGIPVVYEVGSRIPSTYHHRYDDGKLCLAAQMELEAFLEHPKSLLDFVQRYVVSYLFTYSYYEKYDTMPAGERSHGDLGEIEFLREYLGMSNDRNIRRLLLIINDPRFAFEPGRKCPCGSGMDMEGCQHQMVLNNPDKLKYLKMCSFRLTLADD